MIGKKRKSIIPLKTGCFPECGVNILFLCGNIGAGVENCRTKLGKRLEYFGNIPLKRMVNYGKITTVTKTQTFT